MPWIEYVVFYGGGHQGTAHDYKWVESASASALAGLREELMDRYERSSGSPIIKVLKPVRTLPPKDRNRLIAEAAERLAFAQEAYNRTLCTVERKTR